MWVEGFNKVRNLLYNKNTDIANKAKDELQKYFDTIAQASLGDLYDHDTNLSSSPQGISKISDILIPPKDQDLRHMRHHVHCQNLHGVVGYKQKHPYCVPIGESNPKDVINTNMIVQKNTNVLLKNQSSDNYFSKEQCDILAYTYPYHMKECETMKPLDC